LCHSSKSETQSALGHDYYDDIGVCKSCGKFKYDISWSQEKESYGKALYCDYYLYEGYVVAIVKMSMKESGNKVWVSWSLHDSNNKLINGTITMKDWESSYFDFVIILCYDTNLKVEEKYSLTIEDIGVL